jgi:phosphoglycerate dehydrogenase-like enzyme
MSTETYADALRRELPDWTITRAATPAEELALAAKAPIITGHRFPTELLEAAENLELFACTAAGRNYLPVEQLAANDITIADASGTHGPEHSGARSCKSLFIRT